MARSQKRSSNDESVDFHNLENDIAPRLQRLMEERDVINESIKDLMTEAKSRGYKPAKVKRGYTISKLGYVEAMEDRDEDFAYARAFGAGPDSASETVY